MNTTLDEISKRIHADRLLILNAEEAGDVLRDAELVQKHPTLAHGDLTILSWRGQHAVLEQADEETFPLRLFEDQHELDLFVERRLDQYERMWDGCGCRIDYFEEH